MNKKVLAFITALALPTMVFAKGGNHPMSGCGLGYVLFGNTDNSKLMQLFAATTNWTSANQTFGITSGTSGCTEDGAVKFVKEAELYAEVNLDTLRREMAAGSGESVQTFASLLGASDIHRDVVVALMKSNYSTLFPNSNTTSTDLLASLATLFSQHADLLS